MKDAPTPVRWRFDLALKCDHDAELIACSQDPAWWAHRWVWTYDPRVSNPWMPMLLWPRQIEYIRWLSLRLRGKGPATVVKPRDIGASWLGAAFGVWCLLFLQGASIGYSSRKLMYVDSPSPDSLFSKIRKILDYLPSWMRPAYTAARSPMPLITSLETGTELKGEGGDNVCRAGRCTLYLLDEFAYMEHQSAVESAVSEGAGSVVYCSTYGSPDDRFRRMVENPDIPNFTWSWRDDPRRDDEWFERKRRTTDEIHFKRDILCDPDASLTGQVFKPEWIDACIAADLRPQGILQAGYDPSGEGTAEAMLAIRRGPVVLRLEPVPGEHDEARAQWAARETGLMRVYFDAGGGYGASAARVLGRRGEAVNGGAAISDGAPDHCELAANVRAGMYLELQWRARNTWLRAQGEDIREDDCLSLPDDPILRRQLLSLTMLERQGGRLLVESKRDMMARGISSPDRADALGYSFCGDVVNGGQIQLVGY